ncbi:MAG TPA: hypothetical protein VIH24_07305 [Candidatus Limnocylindria bacterium]
MTQTHSGDAPAAIGAPAAAPNDPDLSPLGVVAAPEAGGWVVVNLDTLRVVEPGFVWPRREHAVRWAREELERERAEEDEYRRQQDEPTERGLARSWAGQQSQPEKPEPR